MENGTDIGGIARQDILTLEGIVKRYPWFSYARHILLLRLSALGEEVFEEQLRSSAIFLSSRSALYGSLYGIGRQREDISEDTPSESSDAGKETAEKETREEVNPENGPHEDPAVMDSREIFPDETIAVGEGAAKRYVAVGGDFFSREDYMELEEEEDAEKMLSDSPFFRSGQPKRSTMLGEDGKVNFEDLAFYTETLGRIYSDQECYDEAENVFSKLILLYPQKSAYFASLVNQVRRSREEVNQKKK